MEHTRVSSKGQMIIPKRVRQALGLKQGTELAVELLPEGGFAARPKATDRVAQVRSLAGMLAHRGKRMSPARERAAIMAAVLGEDERSKRTARRRS
ncbi:MAG: AbrB/MazE/SpoVT family DNA-binding domain-containing protein [Betaproteobacteria bacterium]|nr:MAG: AbrB/MazE/SpoVT family DNA-binding domain-containing protein [Betaproteobacteria bacterium]